MNISATFQYIVSSFHSLNGSANEVQRRSFTQAVQPDGVQKQGLSKVEPVLGSSVSWEDPEQIVVPSALRPMRTSAEYGKEQLDSVLSDKVWWGGIIKEQTFQNGGEYVDNWPASVVVPEDGRVSGDLLPFNMNTDSYVGPVLLMVLAIAALLLARSCHYLVVNAKAFFSTRRRENLFNDSSDARMQGKYFFSFVLCFALGILMYDFQQVFYPSVTIEISPYMMMGVNLSLLGVGCFMRTVLFAFVNMVFFDRESNSKWLDAYHLLTVFSSVLFLSLALLVVFYEMDFSNWSILFLFMVLIVEIFLIFKTYHIFFEGGLGILHLILYLCSLEILPLLTLWKGMVWLTQELTKLV